MEQTHLSEARVNEDESTRNRLQLICLATGTKLVTGPLAFTPNVIRDCHAESLCRRMFRRWLLDRLAHGQDLDLAGRRFHMCISQLPCGVVNRYKGVGQSCRRLLLLCHKVKNELYSSFLSVFPFFQKWILPAKNRGVESKATRRPARTRFWNGLWPVCKEDVCIHWQDNQFACIRLWSVRVRRRSTEGMMKFTCCARVCPWAMKKKNHRPKDDEALTCQMENISLIVARNWNEIRTSKWMLSFVRTRNEPVQRPLLIIGFTMVGGGGPIIMLVT